MKTLVAVLLSLGAGAVLGVGAVIGIKAAVNPDNTVNTSTQQPVDVLDYGTRS